MKNSTTIFRGILPGLILLAMFAVSTTPAHGVPLARLDIMYIDGQIVSGPLSADLDVLPASVQATFLIGGSTPGGYALGDVAQASLTFGDGAWDKGDLQDFSATLVVGDAGALSVMSLTYAYGPIDTATTNGRLAGNFPLEIQGTDIASGEEFLYRYDTSLQTVTLVPEPESLGLFGLAGLAVLGRGRRRWLERIGCARNSVDRRAASEIFNPQTGEHHVITT